MPVAEATRLREERLGHDWSAEASDRVPGDVSAATLETVRTVLSALPDDRRRLVSLSDLDLLRALDLLAGERLNRAGTLLLLPAEADRPRLVYQFRPTPGGEPTFSERLEGPLVSAFARVMEVVRTRLNSAPLNLPRRAADQLQDFPERRSARPSPTASCTATTGSPEPSRSSTRPPSSRSRHPGRLWRA